MKFYQVSNKQTFHRFKHYYHTNDYENFKSLTNKIQLLIRNVRRSNLKESFEYNQNDFYGTP